MPKATSSTKAGIQLNEIKTLYQDSHNHVFLIFYSMKQCPFCKLIRKSDNDFGEQTVNINSFKPFSLTSITFFFSSLNLGLESTALLGHLCLPC